MDLKQATKVFIRRIDYVVKQVNEKRGSEGAISRAKQEAEAGDVILPVVNTFLNWDGSDKTIEVNGKKFEIKEIKPNFSSFKEAMNETMGK